MNWFWAYIRLVVVGSFCFALLTSLGGCETAYFPECDYDCGYTGGTRSNDLSPVGGV